MKQDLSTLRNEIEAYAAEREIAIFHAMAQDDLESFTALWDAESYPDFRKYVDTARLAGVKLISLASRRFEGYIEEAKDLLETCEIPRDEYRNLNRRITELSAYEGFVCELTLSFTAGVSYAFVTQTPWYRDFISLAEELQELCGFDDDGEESEESGLGGYFSRN